MTSYTLTQLYAALVEARNDLKFTIPGVRRLLQPPSQNSDLELAETANFLSHQSKLIHAAIALIEHLIPPGTPIPPVPRPNPFDPELRYVSQAAYNEIFRHASEVNAAAELFNVGQPPATRLEIQPGSPTPKPGA